MFSHSVNRLIKKAVPRSINSLLTHGDMLRILLILQVISYNTGNTKVLFRSTVYVVFGSGLLGFYRGFSISMMTYGPQASLFWTIFGSAENRLSKLYMRDNNSQHMLHATSAGISSILTNLVITPLDTVRCRYQLNPEARSIRTICTDLFRNEGFRGFYKGWAARTLQNFINAVPVMTIWMWIRRTSIKRKE